MQRIIKNGQILDETWHLLPADASLDEMEAFWQEAKTKA